MTGGNGRERSPVDVLSRPGAGGPCGPAVPPEPFLELVTEPLCTADADARLTSISHGWEELLGRPCDELIGRPLFDLVLPDDAGRLGDALRACRAGVGVGRGPGTLRCGGRHDPPAALAPALGRRRAVRERQ